MKKFLVLTVLGCSLFGAGQVRQASARSLMPPVFHANVLRMMTDRNVPDSRLSGTGGLTLDFARSLLRLTLERTPHCLPGRMCSQVAYPPLVLEMKLVSRNTDGCGNQVFAAERDERPADGALTRVIVRDHRTDHCKYMRAVADTEIEMETITLSRGAGVVKRHFHFDADRLMPEFGDVIR